MSDNLSPGDRQANVAIIIFAKDEEVNIDRIIDAIASQTLSARTDLILSVFVVANGCTDRTAEFAEAAALKVLRPRGVRTIVLDWAKPGKSRSWNRVIHEEVPADVEYIFALDADIEFVDHVVLASMYDLTHDSEALQVVSGRPIKDSLRKPRRTLIDHFSAKVSAVSSHSEAICGQLYLGRASFLKEIWLPDETPGEDGFLNAMVRTRGFSQPFQSDVLSQMTEATHYYEDHSVSAFFAHERRMIVGTMINRWIFEYLNSLQLTDPAGPLIAKLNKEQPDWVDRLIEREGQKRWVIASDLLFRRLQAGNGMTASYLLSLPVRCIATALTMPPAITANRTLKARGAASTW